MRERPSAYRPAWLLLACAMIPFAHAEEPAPAPDWKTSATTAGLSADDIVRLERDRVLVGQREVTQIFMPYVIGDLPPFVTSDSLLNGYNVLFAETFQLAERVRAGRLADQLGALWDRLDGADTQRIDVAPEVLARARRIAKIEIGITYLEAGIARPRELFVLYPWQGRDVLCRGAVLPYHEFATDRRLTDTEWRALLDGGKAAPPLVLRAIESTTKPKTRGAD